MKKTEKHLHKPKSCDLKSSTATTSVTTNRKNIRPPGSLSTKREPICKPKLCSVYSKEMECRKLDAKEVCAYVAQLPILTVTKPSDCHPVPKERSYMKPYRETFCPEASYTERSLSECICVSSLSSMPKSTYENVNMATGKVPMRAQSPLDEEIAASSKSQWKAPCKASDFDEKFDYYIGRCTKEQRERIPPKKRNWATHFCLIEDPRKVQCLKNPKKSLKPKKPESRWKEITEKIKLIENVDTSSSSERSDITCVQIDVDNPFGTDLQMIDYRYTYYKDEQNIQDGKEYLKQKRYSDRKLLRGQMGDYYEDIAYKKKVSTPRVFDISIDYDAFGMEVEDMSDDQKAPPEEPEEKSPEKLAKIVRTMDKNLNKSLIELENETRFGRYYNLYEKKSERKKIQAALKDEEDRQKEEAIVFTVADDDFNKEFSEEKATEIKAKYDTLFKVDKRKWYPHNIAEVKKLRQTMKRSKAVLRDQAVIKKKFYEDLGVHKNIKEADLEISSESTALSSHSEQSTNDEDTLEVGYREPNKFYLRGKLFKLGSEPRGKLHITQKTEEGRALRTCMTRTEWYENLVPRSNKRDFTESKPSSIVKAQAPDDPKLRLFAPGPPDPITYDHSTVKAFAKEPIGLQYEKGKEKTLRVKKPKTLKVKKFNLTGYLFGARKEDAKSASSMTSLQFGQAFCKLSEYLHQKKKKANMERMRKKRQRMHYLGIPAKDRSLKKVGVDHCLNSESEDSDWIPDDEPVAASNSFMDKISNVTCNRSGCAKVITGPNLYFNHMPAPKFREMTLKRHPRRPRDLNDDFDPASGNWSEIPRLEFPPDDKIVPYNLKVPKTEYAHRFSARHHHDHSDPKQHKYLHVRYQSVVPKIAVEEDNVKVQKKTKRPFEKALPQGPHPGKFVDRSVPELPPVNLRQQDPYSKQIFELKCAKAQKARKKMIKKASNEDKAYSSNRHPKNSFPGQEAYLKLIKDVTQEIKKRLMNVEELTETYVIDKDAYIKELEDDIKSIQSCVSTLESSICTNFTNDSGSFLMIQDDKLPMDFIRKSLVPFEEINRVRIRLEPAKPTTDEHFHPYAVVPYGGQKKEQQRIFKGDADKFFTFNTRIRNGLRRRLEVEPKNIDKSLIGNEKIKNVSNHRDETSKDMIEGIARHLFKVKTSMQLVKSALRQKFEVWHIQSQVVEQKEAERKEEQYAQDIINLQALFTKLFTRWQKTEFDRTSVKVRSVKLYLEATHLFKKQLADLERNYMKLNMQIVFTESDWVRRTILQNFHYLLMKNSWREEHDWIHKKEDGTLENYRESIEKRKFVNIRVRDRDDAWAIKDFYENHYLKNKHPIVIVYPDADTFMRGVLKLKARTFVCLLELHYTLWILTNLQRTHREYVRWSEDFIESRSKFVKSKCSKKYFMEDREEKLKNIALDLLENPLKEALGDPMLREMKSIGDVVYNYVVPGAAGDKLRDLGIVEKITLIFDLMIQLMNNFEPFSPEKVKKYERDYRKQLAYRKRQSKASYALERRIEQTISDIKKNLAPPFKKPKRTGKLPRGYLKKKPIIIPKSEKRVSARTMFFHKAFIPEGEVASIKSEDLDKVTMANIKDTCIPFYFDHFLRVNNYEPNYNFKTQVELAYGPEERPFRYKKCLPIVFQKLEAWEAMKKKQEQDDIAKSSNLYQT